MQKPKPKKQLGQHFLTDKRIAQRIVDTLSALPQDKVVEIGPGAGVLTGLLLQKYATLTAIEIDRESVAHLQHLFSDKALTILEEDFLKWDAGVEEYAYFIGNLPYNISSPIFFKFLEEIPTMQEGVFMIQKEVADRICASEGNKIYGILSVLIGYYYEREYLFTVAPGVFFPPPKVKSAVIRLRRKPEEQKVSWQALKAVVKAGFSQRRKTLRNALGQLRISDFPEKEAWMGLRAEQLSITQYEVLASHWLGNV